MQTALELHFTKMQFNVNCIQTAIHTLTFDLTCGDFLRNIQSTHVANVASAINVANVQIMLEQHDWKVKLQTEAQLC